MSASDTPSCTVDLPIGGMTCASCAARVEKKPNKLSGVKAEVHFATKFARVNVPADVDLDEVVAAEVGIEEVISEALPRDKVAVAKRLQGKGRVAAMIGDGVNDAAIPRAMAGLLNPIVAGAAMGFSPVFVIANSLRLCRFTGHTAA
ncbi:MAG: HAD family hydrolase [Actinomycetales bacterium]|nr:HAD family hydrolase [Actinomycetales bacterium]